MLVSDAVAQDGEVESVNASAVDEESVDVGEGVELGKVRVGRGVQVAEPVEAEAGEADGARDGVLRVIQVRLSELEGKPDVEVEPVNASAVDEESVDVGEGVELGKVRVGRGVQVAEPVEAEAGEADGARDGVPRVTHVRLSELEGVPDMELEAGP